MGNEKPPHTSIIRDGPLSSESKQPITCPVPSMDLGTEPLGSNQCETLNAAGCPLATSMQERLAFETLLAELSTKFVNVSASQVDSQIEWGLRRIVELFGIDRSGLGEVSSDEKQLVVTHSYQLPGIPPSAKLMLDSQFPTYARMVHHGMVIRLPDDLPNEATQEREYCRSTGLKSNLTIPLIVMGTVVGGIGFSCYRSQRILPDELIRACVLLVISSPTHWHANVPTSRFALKSNCYANRKKGCSNSQAIY